MGAGEVVWFVHLKEFLLFLHPQLGTVTIASSPVAFPELPPSHCEHTLPHYDLFISQISPHGRVKISSWYG